MSDNSAFLDLPYLQPSQAQKHVTHNEALRRLDVLVQLSVPGLDQTAPPDPAAEGSRHIVGAEATGAWADKDGQIAVFEDGAWHFINATADATNRLSVNADRSLFNHDGAGHRLVINKAAASDTASMIFQSGSSSRAEMGLAGDENFSIKVSANGAFWTTALQVDAAAVLQHAQTADGRALRLAKGSQVLSTDLLLARVGPDLMEAVWTFPAIAVGATRLTGSVDVDHQEANSTPAADEIGGVNFTGTTATSITVQLRRIAGRTDLAPGDTARVHLIAMARWA